MEIGLAVGGAFISSGLAVLFDRLAPQGELLNMFQRHKHDFRLFKKLRTTLLGLQVVLSDAENKQASNPYVIQWLNELQDAVDNAENLMEEINYEVLRLKVEGRHQYLEEIDNQQVSDLNLCLSGEFLVNIKEQLEDTVETLEELEKQIGRLDLKAYIDLAKQGSTRQETSVVDESDIFGRHNEIEELIDRLLSIDANGKNLVVIPIVGMAGIGKTTLAKVVYNDEKVRDHFDLKAWFCVTEQYDAARITKGLLQEIGSFDSMVGENLNQLQIKLKESLKGKRFLIVLDDVWNDKYIEWDDLRNPFVQGEIGSKIIVTTRKESVALMMGSGVINVGTLSSEVSWDLFKRHSLENRDLEEHPKLEEVGKQIATKCKGLPLALKALAGMLRSKSEVEKWRDILRSEIWELPSRSNDILPALMLSYNDLPVHLKRCFAYCAIFPKDHLFCKEQVINLWIANGLVQWLQKDNSIEDSANQYFLELRSRSLFERVPKSSPMGTEMFLMHDLVNDLAQISCSKLCFRLENNEGSHMLEQTRHLSYSMSFGEFEKLKSLCKLEQLRTLLPISMNRFFPIYNQSKRVLHKILPRLISLRALSLSGYDIKELPNALFIKLKLLRFLDLSWTPINKLPDSICILYNLETLLLSYCRNLEELPPHMEKLSNLRHLDISNISGLKMPLYLSKLKSLHVLVGANFHLGGCSGSRIGDLGQLHNLYGSLSILELQNVVDTREVVKANMREKNHVEQLSLEWSESIAENSQNERDILDELQPNANIKILRITGYKGTKFPDWLADHSFLKLVQMSLSNCTNCDSLPALGQLPSLRALAIRGMHRITEVTEEFYGGLSSKKPFNSLKSLEFAKMLEWKQWHILGSGEFPTLERLEIKGCPKLIGKLPENLCSLTVLIISECPGLILETPIQLLSLDWLQVVGSPKLGIFFDDAEMFTSQIQGMNQIASLNIDDCHSITSLHISCLPNTNRFRIRRCHLLTRLLIPTGTKHLQIEQCENLETIPAISRIQMTSLCRLSIYKCQKLNSLPERMQELLPSLKHLSLRYCPEIESFPEGGLPFDLEVLLIEYCKKLVNGRKEWFLQILRRLTDLTIIHDGSDEEILADENWQLPCTIRRFEVNNLKTLSSQVLKSLTSLKSLSIRNSPQVWSLLEEGIPSSLTSLQSLDIGCDQLQSIPESAVPASLSWLTIFSCPNLQSLPVKRLPSSISALSILNCPLLQPRLEFEKGDYWPNIAQIPTLRVDKGYL